MRGSLRCGHRARDPPGHRHARAALCAGGRVRGARAPADRHAPPVCAARCRARATGGHRPATALIWTASAASRRDCAATCHHCSRPRVTGAQADAARVPPRPSVAVRRASRAHAHVRQVLPSPPGHRLSPPSPSPAGRRPLDHSRRPRVTPCVIRVTPTIPRVTGNCSRASPRRPTRWLARSSTSSWRT